MKKFCCMPILLLLFLTYYKPLCLKLGSRLVLFASPDSLESVRHAHVPVVYKSSAFSHPCSTERKHPQRL